MAGPDPEKPASDLTDMVAAVPPPRYAKTDGLTINTEAALDEITERQVDEIEMIGEESAAGFRPPGHSSVSAGMRYLHASRTIHQLVTDRNRSVGLYIAVATLLWTASSALLNARPSGKLILPIEKVQEWCLPVTFAILAILALFVGFLLIRTRIGLIYEVAKMNTLLGLPVGRVKRVNPLSIFFIMHLIVSLAGGGSAALFAMHMLVLGGTGLEAAVLPSTVIGITVATILVLLYVVMVLQTTSDHKLRFGTSGMERARGLKAAD